MKRFSLKSELFETLHENISSKKLRTSEKNEYSVSMNEKKHDSGEQFSENWDNLINRLRNFKSGIHQKILDNPCYFFFMKTWTKEWHYDDE